METATIAVTIGLGNGNPYADFLHRFEFSVDHEILHFDKIEDVTTDYTENGGKNYLIYPEENGVFAVDIVDLRLLSVINNKGKQADQEYIKSIANNPYLTRSIRYQIGFSIARNAFRDTRDGVRSF